MKYLWTEDTGAGLHFWKYEYQIFIDENPAQELVEVYDYEWTDEEI